MGRSQALSFPPCSSPWGPPPERAGTSRLVRRCKAQHRLKSLKQRSHAYTRRSQPRPMKVTPHGRPIAQKLGGIQCEQEPLAEALVPPRETADAHATRKGEGGRNTKTKQPRTTKDFRNKTSLVGLMQQGNGSREPNPPLDSILLLPAQDLLYRGNFLSVLFL